MPLIVKKKKGGAGLEIPREVRGQGPEAVNAYMKDGEKAYAAKKAEEAKRAEAAKTEEKGADK